jgi:hypothetical protein
MISELQRYDTTIPFTEIELFPKEENMIAADLVIYKKIQKQMKPLYKEFWQSMIIERSKKNNQKLTELVLGTE